MPERDAVTGLGEMPLPAPSPQGDGDPGYDQRQLEAVLVTCATCGREFYMTKPSAVCGWCR